MTFVGRYDEAEQELLEAHRMFESARGSKPGEVRQVVARLVELYGIWSKPQKEAEWQAELRKSSIK